MACGDVGGGNATVGASPGDGNEDAFFAILAAGFNEADPRLRGMRRLTGEEIARLIVGRTLIEDRTGLGGMPNPQGERFIGAARVIVTYDRGIKRSGSYAIRDNALCVRTAVPARVTCRALYRDGNGRFAQAFYGPARKVTPVIFTRLLGER